MAGQFFCQINISKFVVLYTTLYNIIHDHYLHKLQIVVMKVLFAFTFFSSINLNAIYTHMLALAVKPETIFFLLSE